MAKQVEEALRNKVKEKHYLMDYRFDGERYELEATEINKEINDIRNKMPKISKTLLKFLARADQELERLESDGMIDGYLQTQGDQFEYIYSTQKEGKRHKIYIGNKKEKIVQAQGHLDNFVKHRKLSRDATDIMGYIRYIEREMKAVIRVLEGIELPEIEK